MEAHKAALEKRILTLDQLEQDYILEILTYFNGSRTLTAQALGRSYRWLTLKLSLYRDKGIYVPRPRRFSQ